MWARIGLLIPISCVKKTIEKILFNKNQLNQIFSQRRFWERNKC